MDGKRDRQIRGRRGERRAHVEDAFDGEVAAGGEQHVAVDANALSHDRERCLEAGMDTYLSKPFAEADLQAILASYLLKPHPRSDSRDSGFHAHRLQ